VANMTKAMLQSTKHGQSQVQNIPDQ